MLPIPDLGQRRFEGIGSRWSSPGLGLELGLGPELCQALGLALERLKFGPELLGK